MSDNQYYPNRDSSSSHISYEHVALQQTLMQRVFLWMTIGLGLTGLAAYMTYSNGWGYSIATNSTLFYGLIIAEVGLVIGLSSLIARINFLLASLLFGIYSVLNGLTLSVIFMVYTMDSIAVTFFVTAGTFGAMALYGYFTKRDLSSMRSILMMALIGLIIASVVNIFLQNSMLQLITSAIGVLVFVGLTAYDVQKIKRLFSGAYEDDEDVKKLSVLGALTLYLDFINLFLYLLRFLGSRRN